MFASSKSNTLQIWVSSVNSQIFFLLSFFVLNDSVPGHSPVIDFTSFPWFSLVFFFFFFFCSPTRVSLPYPCPSNTQWSSWCEKIEQWTAVQWEEFDSKADGRYPTKGHYQSSTRLQKHQRMRWARGVLHPRSVCVSPRHVTFLTCNPGCLLLQMKGASRSTAKIQIDKVH